jgi:hypothetical protein
MKTVVAALGVAFASIGVALGEEPAADVVESVADTLAALHADPTAQFSEQQGWTVVANGEGGHAAEWFFTPPGHPAHPAFVKRVVTEQDGVGVIELTAFCHAAQSTCDALVEDFRQRQLLSLAPPSVARVALDVGIAVNDHDRVEIKRLEAEEGKAAEIRMDDVLKMVIVPTLDEHGAVLLWTAMYEFDGADYRLVATPQFASPASGTARVELASASGNRFGLSITSQPVARE